MDDTDQIDNPLEILAAWANVYFDAIMDLPDVDGDIAAVKEFLVKRCKENVYAMAILFLVAEELHAEHMEHAAKEKAAVSEAWKYFN